MMTEVTFSPLSCCLSKKLLNCDGGWNPLNPDAQAAVTLQQTDLEETGILHT